MKKPIIILSAVVAFLCIYCFLNQRETQKQITQLQQEVTALQEMNGLPSSYEMTDDASTSSKPVESSKTNDNKQQTVKSSAEKTAVEAIQYCLKMYVPDLKYTNIRSVPQSDGTVDVIIDYKEKYTGSVEHTYYNVTVYSDKEFKVNSCRGWMDGDFPHRSRMILP